MGRQVAVHDNRALMPVGRRPPENVQARGPQIEGIKYILPLRCKQNIVGY